MSDLSIEANLHRGRGLGLLAGIEVCVTVQLGQASTTFDRLLELTPGSVVQLDREVDAPLDLLVNGALVARGEVVEAGGRYGLRITEIVGGAGALR